MKKYIAPKSKVHTVHVECEQIVGSVTGNEPDFVFRSKKRTVDFSNDQDNTFDF